MDDEIILISAEYEKDELKQQKSTESRRKIWCTIKSISRAEWREAAMQGLKPEIMVVTPSINYGGELRAEYRGMRYSVYRTYRRQDSDEIELYLSQQVGA